MAARPQPVLARSPWQFLGRGKYVIFIPLVIKAVHAEYFGGDGWWFHILLASGLRFLQAQLWHTFTRTYNSLVKKYEINTLGVSYEQVDREFHSDEHIIVQMLVAAVAHSYLPGFRHLPLWDARGIVTAALLHIGPVEFLYYWLHRAMHSSTSFFGSYHSFHHESVHTEPATSGVSTFVEQIAFAGLAAVPILGTVVLQGGASVGMVYAYWLTFDFFKNLAHCNVEIMPLWAFQALPILRYLVITPSYHSLHHTTRNSNYCLFMPIYDHMGGTVNPKTTELHAHYRQGRKAQVPDFVFLVHCLHFTSFLHISFMFRNLASDPFVPSWFLLPFVPPMTLVVIALWIWGKVFVASRFTLDNVSAQTWGVPRFGFHYFIPPMKDSINRLIEGAILEADRMGVKVINLAALNKNEALNSGGKLFVDKHKDLRVRVVHGNTLTAACIVYALPEGTAEVFMTGATSKLGRAIALYLCRHRVRVLMLTASRERFDAIVREAPEEFQHFIIRVTTYEAGENCKTWVMGKMASKEDQRWAPSGTHFHQFVVPPIPIVRDDCTYGKLAAMRLPPQVKCISTCEFSCDRYVVHACHAGGLLHHIEGWTHHEVGGVAIDRIDIVWAAAMKHGFVPSHLLDIVP